MLSSISFRDVAPKDFLSEHGLDIHSEKKEGKMNIRPLAK